MMQPYYQDEYCTIYHGDCREIIPDLNSVELVLTDPPYGVNFDFSKNRSRKKGLNWGKNRTAPTDRKGENIAGDDTPFDPKAILSIGAHEYIIWGANNFSHLLPPATCWLVWDKKRYTTPDNHGDAELAWTNLGGVIRIYRQLWRGVVREGIENVNNSIKLHPAQKPLGLMKWCIELSKTEGVILDPYIGSGTTLVAAKLLNRKAIGIEIKEEYCEITVKRLKQEVLSLQLGRPCR